jgi:hypothetical protein
MDFNPKHALESEIAHLFKVKALDAIDKEIANSPDLNKNGKADLPELKEHVLAFIDKTKAAYAGQDIAKIAAGIAAIAQGVKTVLGAVDVPKLVAGIKEARVEVVAIANLVGMLLEFYHGKFNPKEVEAVAQDALKAVEGK